MSAFETKFNNVTEPQAVAIMLRSFPELIIRSPDIITMKEAESFFDYMIAFVYQNYDKYERLRKATDNFRGHHGESIPSPVEVPNHYSCGWLPNNAFGITRSKTGHFDHVDDMACTHTYFVDAGVYHFETSTESQLDAFINRANAIIDDYHSVVYPSIVAAPEEQQ